MINLRPISLLGLLAWAAFSCNDPITVDANFTKAELVVDAWINDQPTTQSIQLSLTQNYFDNTLPPAVTNAEVVVVNTATGEAFPFVHQGGGSYQWQPLPGQVLGSTGDVFALSVKYDGFDYAAQSELRRVPPMDSIGYETREPELGNPAGIFAQFYAKDLPGIGDTYWIKTFKNGNFLNKPTEMNLSFDGTFDSGSGTDGILFIAPIRELINRVPDPDTDDNSDVSPYAVGDTIRVELHGIPNDAYRFLSIAQEQMTNGDNALFALPVANSPTNILPVTAGAPAALGYFCISAVSATEVVVE